MSETSKAIISKELLEQYETYYGQKLAQEPPCWNDTISREKWEQQWLVEADLQGIETGWSPEVCFSWMEAQLEAGETVLLCVAKRCLCASREKTLALLQSYLKEALLFWDWDAPSDPERVKKMEQFAEAAQLMECLCPEEFSDFCVQWISQIPLDHEYVPELLMKGIVHTRKDDLETILQSAIFNTGIKIGLLNYICESDIRSEALFNILKNMFKQFKDREEKHFLGILLGEYGDARAIPVLRKYLETLVQETPFDPELCREIASAVHKLGGQYKDIMHI